MQLIMSFILIIFTIIVFVTQKKIYNALFLFNIFWILILILDYFKFYGLYDTSFEAITIISLGIIFINIGYFFNIRIFRKPSKNKSYAVNYKLNYFFIFLVILFLIVRIITLLNLLRSGVSWWHLRLMVANSGDNIQFWGSELNVIIYTYIVAPYVYAIVPLAIADYVENKSNMHFYFSVAIMGLFFILATVSRNLLVFSVIYYVFLVIIVKKGKFFDLKKMKSSSRNIIVILILMLLIGIMSSLRKESSVNFFKEAYVYLVGALPSLSIRLTEPVSSFRTYGLLTFRGLIRIIFIIFNKFGIMYPSTYLKGEIILDNLENFIKIGDSINMNAYATIFYFFFIDGGIFGLILFSLLFGMIFRRAFVNIEKNPNVLNLAYYSLILQQIFFSMARIYTVLPTRGLSYLILPFLVNYINKEENINE